MPAVQSTQRTGSLLRPPVFPGDDLRTERAATLHWLLVGFAPLIALYSLGLALTVPGAALRYLVLFLAIEGVIVTAFLRNRAGEVRQGGWIIVAGVWGTILAFGVAAGGFESVGYLIGTVAVVGAGVLLGPRSAFGLAGATIIVGIGLAIADGRGWLPPPTITHTRTSVAIIAVAAFVMLVLLMQLNARELRAALGRAQRELEERRLAEGALEASRREYEELVASVPGAVYEFREGPDGRMSFPFMSEGIRDLVGIGADEVERDPDVLFGRVAPEALDALRESIRASHVALVPWHHDFPVITREGVPRWLRGRSVPAALPDGGVVCHGVLTDITDQRQAVSLLQAALESTADGILVVDNGGAVTGFNKRFLKMWQIPSDLAESRDDQRLLQFVVDQLADPEAFLGKVRDLYANPDAISFDELRFRDGRVFERYSRPQRTEGRTVGRVWSFRNVTESRLAAEERRRLELQLFEAQKLEALGTLAGGIAHDFNNILTAIVGHTELARWEVEGETREALDEVIHAADRARDLVQQILLVGRGRAVAHEPVALGEVLEDALRLLRATIPRGIAIETRLDAADVVVRGNRSQLHQVLMNLGVNAWHAMGQQGSLTVTLQTEDVRADRPPVAGLAPGGYAVLTVRDTGHGMTPDTMQRIFDPFFTTKERGRGTGLGLSVVRGIVHGHEGGLLVESTPGEGTAFRVWLPVEAAGAGAAGPEFDRGISKGQGQRILAVDDEPAIAEFLRAMLTRLGYHPVVAQDPREALRRLREDPAAVDLVFTDLSMPGMTGIELGREALALRPDLPVVVATGFDQGWTRERIRGLGFRDLVAKPYTAQQVAAVLEEALEGAGTGSGQGRGRGPGGESRR